MNSVEVNLPLVASGKVRELYELPDNKLLFVASDRISAYDVVLKNGIPDKGLILTKVSRMWFDLLASVCANHVADSGDVLAALPKNIADDESVRSVKDRAIVVNKLKVLPLEVIVRGYISGSAWKEYLKSGTIHGEKPEIPLQESEKLPKPLFTPSTKAEQGQHDENISREEAAKIVGADLAKEIERVALELYTRAHEYALERGIIIADTKFEFGLDANNRLILVDEVLTPDSSRFWPLDKYEKGRAQESFDKQFVRDWLVANKLNGVDNTAIPEEVAERTRQKYIDVARLLGVGV